MDGRHSGLLSRIAANLAPWAQPARRARATGPMPGVAARFRRPLGVALGIVLSGVALPAEADERPVLRVGTPGDYAPFSLAVEDGAAPGASGAPRYEGFDVEVAGRLARDLDMRLELVPFTWPELSKAVADDRFDVAMGGVTWRPFRAVVGYMSLAVASGGPCLMGDPSSVRIGVNRGGILERYARARFADREVVAVDDNRSLPAQLRSGLVGAIVTDSFELASFVEVAGEAPVSCEPRRDRKVYWIAPGAATALGPRIDAWILAHESELSELRALFFGEPARRSEVDHLVDLLARRLSLMPEVGAIKRARGIEIEDLEREASVLASSIEAAAAAGLAESSVRDLFAVQIDLAKAIQRRTSSVEPSGLDLEREIRPLLIALGARIVDGLRRVAPLSAEELDRRSELLRDALEPAEWARLRAALLAVRPEPS